MKLYVLLYWYYDGDSHPVHNFEGVFKTPKDAKKAAGEDAVFLTENEFVINQGEKEPITFGSYGSDGKYEIREEEIK